MQISGRPIKLENDLSVHFKRTFYDYVGFLVYQNDN